MSRTLLGVIAFLMITAPGALQAQSRWRFELRGGAAFPTEDLHGASLGTGFGLEGTVGYRIQPHLSVYAGWDWHRFPADDSFTGPETDFEETGYAFGLLFEHPVGPSESLALQLRAGATYNHIETENTSGEQLADSEHGLGWEAGAGVALRLDDHWQVTPGVRFRALSRDLTVASARGSADLQYLAVELGFTRRF